MKSNFPKKFLVIRFSSLGDILLTTPLLKNIRMLYPESEIHYLTKKSFADILKCNPYISKIISADDELDFAKLKELKKDIQSEQYDLILDAHNNLRTFYLRLFTNSKKFILKKYSFRKFLLVKFKINLMKELPPISKRYCQMLPGSNPDLLPEIFIDNDSRGKIELLLNEVNPDGKKIICIAPSSNHFTKTYPAEYYTEIINKMKNNYLFILTGKGKDLNNIETIISQTGKDVVNLCNRLTLPELAEIVNRSELFISGDTGPMHIAEALNKNLIMMAGSSVKEFGFYPQNESSDVIENNSLKCRPCSHIGRSECPLGHFKCMKELNPSNVYKKACQLLGL